MSSIIRVSEFGRRFIQSRRLAVVGAVGVMWFAAWSAPRDFRVGNYVDDAHYVMLAKSLRVDGAYRTLNLPAQPPETKYPPAFPLLLAIGWSPERRDAGNLDRLRSVNLWLVGAVAGALTLVGAASLHLNPWAAAGLSVAALLSPRTAELWAAPLSEPLFLLMICFGALFVTAGRSGLAVTCLVAAVYVRTVAVPFLIGPLVVAGLTTRRVPGKLIGAAVAGLAPWLLWQIAHGATVPQVALGMHGSYGRWYLDSLAADPVAVLWWAPVTNLLLFLQELGRSLLSVRSGSELLATAIGGLALLGLWRSRYGAPGLTLGLAGYVGLVVLWPFPPARFVAAVWPLVLLMAAGAVSRGAPGIAAVALALTLPSLRSDQAVLTHRIRTRLSDATIEQVRPHVRTTTVLATTNPPLFYLHFNVPTVPSQRMRAYRWYRDRSWDHAWGDASDLVGLIRVFDADLVVAEGRASEGSALAEVRDVCPGLLRPVDPAAPEAGPFRVDRAVACRP